MPEYSTQASRVISALRAVQEADEAIWLDRALLAVAELMPESAIGYALHRPNVWARERRLQLRRDGPPAVRGGILLADLVDAAEAAADADDSRWITEVHLARALSSRGAALMELGVSVDALVDVTTERSAPAPGLVISKRPRARGAARVPILDERLAGIDLSSLLDEHEYTGRVERKRSILNTEEGAIVAHVDAAVALVNGNRESPCFLIFGQDDDHAVRGEIDHRGSPLGEGTVARCRLRLVERLNACTPPVLVRWEAIERDGKRVWIACLLGRERGGLAMTPHGTRPVRSGESTHSASQDEVIAAARESVTDSDRPAETPEPSTSDAPSGTSAGAAQRLALERLRDSIGSYLAAPPDIPQRVEDRRKLENWRPVVDPILARASHRGLPSWYDWESRQTVMASLG